VLIALGGVSWWLFSPLFLHTSSNATNPFNNSAATTNSSSTNSKPASGAIQGPATLATGKFIDKPNSGQGLNNDHGSGNVTIGKTADGKYLIHLDQLNVTNGPDLHVYLAPTANSTDGAQVKSEGVDLGLLSASEGSLNVGVPTDIATHLTKYHSVVIFCKTFAVIFTTAPLTFASGS
jgi:hypothetical protein